ncbi:MAG: mechanosensitive ion channel domain-containing protein [Sulfurimonadaceae bacterium]
MENLDVNKYWDMAIQNGAEYGLNIIGAVIIFYVGKMVSNGLRNLVEKALKHQNVETTLIEFAGSAIYYGLMAVVLLAAISNIGIQTTSFMAILGAAGLAVGLALKDTLSNIGSAVVILVFRPFKVGDYINAGGAEGTVDRISLFTTTISPVDNRMIIVPNSAITAGNITNFSSKAVRRVDHAVGIGYGEDIKKAKEVMYSVIEKSAHTISDPAPLVAVTDLGDSSVNFTVRAWVNSADYWTAYFEMIEEIKYALDEAGISIPFPQMDVHMDKGE